MLSDECCCEKVLYDMEIWIVEVEMDIVAFQLAEKLDVDIVKWNVGWLKVDNG